MWFKVAFWFLTWRSRSLLMVVKNCQALDFFGVKQKNGEHFVHGIWNVWDVFDGESGKGTNSQWVFNAPIWAESLKSCTICSHYTCQIQTKKVLVFFSCCIMMFFDRTLLADLADFLFESVSSMADILRDGEVTY